VYSFGAGLFFLGYSQIPGGLIVERWGMRRISALILWVWGAYLMSLSFIHSADSFFIGRFLLGIAEVGLVPGIRRLPLPLVSRGVSCSRQMAWFFLCSPVALAAGGPLAALLLQIRWFGLAGWRWLALLDGIPALFCGVVT
jgi:ACS family tartrate transporter-like MFS transporter